MAIDCDWGIFAEIIFVSITNSLVIDKINLHWHLYRVVYISFLRIFL